MEIITVENNPVMGLFVVLWRLLYLVENNPVMELNKHFALSPTFWPESTRYEQWCCQQSCDWGHSLALDWCHAAFALLSQRCVSLKEHSGVGGHLPRLPPGDALLSQWCVLFKGAPRRRRTPAPSASWRCFSQWCVCLKELKGALGRRRTSASWRCFTQSVVCFV